MSDSAVFNRINDICKEGDDVKALEALGEEVGVEAVINARSRPGNTSCLHVTSQYDRCSLARQLIAWFVCFFVIDIVNPLSYDMI